MKQKEIIKFYDFMAESSADEWYEKPILLPVIREFVNRLIPSPRVLDMGCGTGHESMRLTGEGAVVTGIDISPASIEVAKKRNPGSTFHVMDFLSLDPDLGPFDGVFCSGSLIHLTPENLPLAAGIIAGLLAPEGYCLTIMQEGLKPRVHYPRVGETRIRRTVYRFTEAAVREAFTEAGFTWDGRITLDGKLSRDHWAGFQFHLPSDPA